MPFSYRYLGFANAASFQFSDGTPGFGSEYSIQLDTTTPVSTGRDYITGKSPILFTSASVTESATLSGNIYTTVSTAKVNGLSVDGGFLTADSIECTLTAVYNSDWYTDPQRPKRPRILPTFKATNLLILGYAYFDQHLQLPGDFLLTAAQQSAYFGGQGSEKTPAGIVPDNFPVSIPGTTLTASADTRRVTVPGHGIVAFADWQWNTQPPYFGTFQTLTAIGLGLTNPGTGGPGSTGGGGMPGG